MKKLLSILLSIVLFSSTTVYGAPSTYKPMPLPNRSSGAFKAYMDYRAITSRSSSQYKLQRRAYTDRKGLRRIGTDYVVAMGTFYSKAKVGKRLRITFSDGQKINVIIGDVKSNRHTDSKHQYCRFNRSIVEFIVDTRRLSKLTKRLGTVAEFPGRIIKIEENIF